MNLLLQFLYSNKRTALLNRTSQINFNILNENDTVTVQILAPIDKANIFEQVFCEICAWLISWTKNLLINFFWAV